jgi:hypothetical protein
LCGSTDDASALCFCVFCADAHRYSPHVLEVRVSERRKVARAKLYYLRRKPLKFSRVAGGGAGGSGGGSAGAGGVGGAPVVLSGAQAADAAARAAVAARAAKAAEQ